eukprot:g10694.t1
MGAMATAAVALLVSFTSVEGHSTLWVHGETATQSFVAIPAVWNAYLPSFGQPKLSVKAPLDRESVNLQPSFSGRAWTPERLLGRPDGAPGADASWKGTEMHQRVWEEGFDAATGLLCRGLGL